MLANLLALVTPPWSGDTTIISLFFNVCNKYLPNKGIADKSSAGTEKKP